MKMTYEELLQAMLDRVPSDVDKREGSVIYDALAPCAYFLAQQNFQLDNFIDLVFPDTALGEYLNRAAEAYNVSRKPATNAVRKMTTSGSVEIGTRWGINNLVYIVKEEESETEYQVECETPGVIGNQYSGAMQPISNITGITAELGDIITPGADEETDEALRERLYTKIRLPATSGNVYHYQQWALEVSGTGAAKVFPLADGPGTVTVLVVDSDKKISSSLPKTVAEYIETMRPIGATVTVKSPDSVTINIKASVMRNESKTLDDVKKAYKNAVDTFLQETVFTTYRISYAKLGSLLLDIPGVEDFEGFLLNEGTGNVVIGEKQIPVTGTIELTEVSRIGVN
jgi:uncharacterized phage protein gp47/JayE